MRTSQRSNLDDRYAISERTASSSFQTIRSSRSSKATAPARTSGAPACACFDAAVEKAYGGKKKIAWMEVYAGEKSFKQFNNWLPDDTVEAFREYYVGIKGPLTTPVGGGIRSLNVALRQLLDLYVCLRPVRWFTGVPSPVKHPEKVDMVIFRENTEDIYAGIEYAAGTPEAQKVLDFLAKEFPKEFKKIRFGIEPSACATGRRSSSRSARRTASSASRSASA